MSQVSLLSQSCSTASLSNDDLLELLHLVLLVIVRKLVEDFLASLRLQVSVIVEALTSDPSSKVQILLHHCNSVCVDGAEVSILKESSKVAFSSLLKGQKSLSLESKLSVDAFANSSDESLEGGLSEHEDGSLLVALDLTEGDSTWPESSLLFHSTLSWGGLLLGLVSLACLGASGDALLGDASLCLLLSCDLLSWHLVVVVVRNFKCLTRSFYYFVKFKFEYFIDNSEFILLS